jgi:hypothetical protein
MEVKERSWVKIVPAVIAGAATVLAAMVPLYCSSKKRFESATQVADVEADALRTQVQKLRAQVQQCETEKVQLVAKPAPTTGTSIIANASNAFVDHDFKFDLKSCKFDGSQVRCDFMVTNLMGDRELSLSEARFIDDSGNEYPSAGFVLGAQSGGFARMILPGAIPVKGSVSFASVRPGTKQIEVLEMTAYNWPQGGNRDTIVAKFQKIPLQ